MHLARGFIEAGWDVAFVSDPVSPLHILNGFSKDLRERFDIYLSGGIDDFDGRLWAYVPGALLTPHNKAVLRTEWVHRNWPKLTWPDIVNKVINKGFGEVDLLYFDSVNQSFWLDAVRFKKSVFRVADKNTGFARYTPAMGKLEHKLARSVDTVIYTAQNLKNYVQDMQPKNTLHVPNGVNFAHFAGNPGVLPEEYKKIPKPIVVYVGAMEEWFDYRLLNQAAEALPDTSFVLIGPDKFARTRLKKLPNIHLLGRRNYADLPMYLQHANIGIIPFDVHGHPELVNSIHPLKLYEYMACGLPVVSVSWDELKNLNSPAVLCQTAEQFITGIREASLQNEHRKEYIEFARGAGWERRVLHIIEQLGL